MVMPLGGGVATCHTPLDPPLVTQTYVTVTVDLLRSVNNKWYATNQSALYPHYHLIALAYSGPD